MTTTTHTGTSAAHASGNILPSTGWKGLSPHLIAKFFPMKKDTSGAWVPLEPNNIEVHAPLLEANMEATLNWQSPFEQASPDTKAPFITAMLQSGALIPTVQGIIGGAAGEEADRLSGIEETLRDLEGKTGITKLNSTQIFTGMPPLKITLTLLFRAYADAYEEVERPLQQLWQWALPQHLAKDSIIERAKTGSVISILFPSEVPQVIGFQYKRRTIFPMVIESIGEPMDSPIAIDGYYARVKVPMVLATLTAIDKRDMSIFTDGV